MSQHNVERVIGRLVTDEAFRKWYADGPEAALEEMIRCGIELTKVERLALSGLDLRLIARMGEALDPRIQKIDACGGRS